MKERIILAIDTSESEHAAGLIRIARDSGALYVKMGLELASATSWRHCSELASDTGVDWVADAKLCDISNTVAKTVSNISNLAHPPFGITMHVSSGREAMRVAQEEAGRIKMLGVTVLTSLTSEDVREIFYDNPATRAEAGASGLVPEKVLRLAKIAVEAGLKGLVCSPQEVGAIKSDPATASLFTMIPGTRSIGVDSHDQSRRTTPAEAIRDGADLLVIGRQIIKAADPALAYSSLVEELPPARHLVENAEKPRYFYE